MLCLKKSRVLSQDNHGKIYMATFSEFLVCMFILDMIILFPVPCFNVFFLYTV